MTLIDQYYLQDATYWGKGASDGFGGHSFDVPIALKVRWEEKNELITDDEGRQIVSRTKVFVSQDLTVGSYLFLGTSAVSNPRTVANAFRILQFKKIPDLFGSVSERKAFL